MKSRAVAGAPPRTLLRHPQRPSSGYYLSLRANTPTRRLAIEATYNLSYARVSRHNIAGLDARVSSLLMAPHATSNQ